MRHCYGRGAIHARAAAVLPLFIIIASLNHHRALAYGGGGSMNSNGGGKADKARAALCKTWRYSGEVTSVHDGVISTEIDGANETYTFSELASYFRNTVDHEGNCKYGRAAAYIHVDPLIPWLSPDHRSYKYARKCKLAKFREPKDGVKGNPIAYTAWRVRDNEGLYHCRCVSQGEARDANRREWYTRFLTPGLLFFAVAVLYSPCGLPCLTTSMYNRMHTKQCQVLDFPSVQATSEASVSLRAAYKDEIGPVMCCVCNDNPCCIVTPDGMGCSFTGACSECTGDDLPAYNFGSRDGYRFEPNVPLDITDIAESYEPRSCNVVDGACNTAWTLRAGHYRRAKKLGFKAQDHAVSSTSTSRSAELASAAKSTAWATPTKPAVASTRGAASTGPLSTGKASAASATLTSNVLSPSPYARPPSRAKPTAWATPTKLAVSSTRGAAVLAASAGPGTTAYAATVQATLPLGAQEVNLVKQQATVAKKVEVRVNAAITFEDLMQTIGTKLNVEKSTLKMKWLQPTKCLPKGEFVDLANAKDWANATGYKKLRGEGWITATTAASTVVIIYLREHTTMGAKLEPSTTELKKKKRKKRVLPSIPPPLGSNTPPLPLSSIPGIVLPSPPKDAPEGDPEINQGNIFFIDPCGLCTCNTRTSDKTCNTTRCAQACAYMPAGSVADPCCSEVCCDGSADICVSCKLKQCTGESLEYGCSPQPHCRWHCTSLGAVYGPGYMRRLLVLWSLIIIFLVVGYALVNDHVDDFWSGCHNARRAFVKDWGELNGGLPNYQYADGTLTFHYVNVSQVHFQLMEVLAATGSTIATTYPDYNSIETSVSFNSTSDEELPVDIPASQQETDKAHGLLGMFLCILVVPSILCLLIGNCIGKFKRDQYDKAAQVGNPLVAKDITGRVYVLDDWILCENLNDALAVKYPHLGSNPTGRGSNFLLTTESGDIVTPGRAMTNKVRRALDTFKTPCNTLFVWFPSESKSASTAIRPARSHAVTEGCRPARSHSATLV